MSKSPKPTKSAASERDLMRERLQQVAQSPTAPGREQAAGGSDPEPASTAPADVAKAEADLSPPPPAPAEPAPAAALPKRVPKPAAASMEKFSVVLPAEEAAMIDGIKQALIRQKIVSRKVPDSWLIRLAIVTFDPAGKDLAGILSRMKEQDGRGKR